MPTKNTGTKIGPLNSSRQEENQGKSETCKILDPACGGKMFYIDKNDPDVLFGDIRKWSGSLCDGRVFTVSPDMEMDYRNLPFPDATFSMVIFDPPHLTRVGPNGWQRIKYGVLTENWQEELELGFKECFRVLKAEGVLIFKWSEVHLLTKDVLKLAPYRPVIMDKGHGKSSRWAIFMKLDSKKIVKRGGRAGGKNKE